MTNQLEARFRNLDFEPIERRALAYVREQWKRRARQEAIERSGACIATGRLECNCPNCVEHRTIVHRAFHYGQLYGIGGEEAFERVCREITGGVVPTPWSDVAGTYGDR